VKKKKRSVLPENKHHPDAVRQIKEKKRKEAEAAAMPPPLPMAPSGNKSKLPQLDMTNRRGLAQSMNNPTRCPFPNVIEESVCRAWAVQFETGHKATVFEWGGYHLTQGPVVYLPEGMQFSQSVRGIVPQHEGKLRPDTKVCTAYTTYSVMMDGDIYYNHPVRGEVDGDLQLRCGHIEAKKLGMPARVWVHAQMFASPTVNLLECFYILFCINDDTQMPIKMSVWYDGKGSVPQECVSFSDTWSLSKSEHVSCDEGQYDAKLRSGLLQGARFIPISGSRGPQSCSYRLVIGPLPTKEITVEAIQNRNEARAAGRAARQAVAPPKAATKPLRPLAAPAFPSEEPAAGDDDGTGADAEQEDSLFVPSHRQPVANPSDVRSVRAAGGSSSSAPAPAPPAAASAGPSAQDNPCMDRTPLSELEWVKNLPEEWAQHVTQGKAEVVDEDGEVLEEAKPAFVVDAGTLFQALTNPHVCRFVVLKLPGMRKGTTQMAKDPAKYRSVHDDEEKAINLSRPAARLRESPLVQVAADVALNCMVNIGQLLAPLYTQYVDREHELDVQIMQAIRRKMSRYNDDEVACARFGWNLLEGNSNRALVRMEPEPAPGTGGSSGVTGQDRRNAEMEARLIGPTATATATKAPAPLPPPMSTLAPYPLLQFQQPQQFHPSASPFYPMQPFATDREETPGKGMWSSTASPLLPLHSALLEAPSPFMGAMLATTSSSGTMPMDVQQQQPQEEEDAQQERQEASNSSAAWGGHELGTRRSGPTRKATGGKKSPLRRQSPTATPPPPAPPSPTAPAPPPAALGATPVIPPSPRRSASRHTAATPDKPA
jgi:hypothetical protein